MRGGVDFDYGDPLGCSEKEEKRRGEKKHKRKKSVRPFTRFSTHGEACFTAT